MELEIKTPPTTTPQPIKVDGRYFYNSKDLLTYKPEFYYGCTAKPRNIIKKKNIPTWEYVYATYEKSLNKWNPSTATCKKAQLLISKQWVDENYFKSSLTLEKKKKVIIKKSTLQQPQPKPTLPLQREVDASAVYEESEEEEVLEEEGVKQEAENAPPILYLDDAEKFHDADGNVIEIETRGERHEDKIYFKVKDVSVGFGMPNLNDTLIDKDRGYTRGTDYKIMFNRLSSVNDRCCTIKKCLFLTYEGLLRVLFVSRNKNATLFRKWATTKLFTIQMGTREQKVKLGAEILNTSPRTLKAVLDKHAANFPSIYLMSLGKVRELREIFGIPSDKLDDSTVYKFGFTEDLSRRVIELENQYSKIKGVTISMGTFHVVDTKYTSEAENKVRELCGAFEVRINKTVQGFNELVVLDDKQFAIVRDLYSKYGENFAGATLGLQKQIVELKDSIKEYENVIIQLKMTIQHNNELHEKDMNLKDTVIDLKDTVIENWKLKHQIATQRDN
jgi:hypothetical protein